MLQVILDTIKDDQEKEEVASPGLVMSHVYRLLRQTGPEGSLEFRSLPVNISDNLDSAADAAATEMPNFEQACVSQMHIYILSHSFFFQTNL
jgi:hypothetical protein